MWGHRYKTLAGKRRMSSFTMMEKSPLFSQFYLSPKGQQSIIHIGQISGWIWDAATLAKVGLYLVALRASAGRGCPRVNLGYCDVTSLHIRMIRWSHEWIVYEKLECKAVNSAIRTGPSPLPSQRSCSATHLHNRYFLEFSPPIFLFTSHYCRYSLLFFL